MSILCYLWIIILVPSLVCPGLLERACPFWFCVSCYPLHLLLIKHELVELVKGLQNLKTDDEEESMHKEGTSLQEGPLVCEHVNGKLKLLCRFGGRILPGPYHGNLRYVGGHTRIISANQGITFSELIKKLVNTYGQSLAIKYQLPDEKLDSLVSVTCDEDLQNMIEEYAGYPGTNYGPRIPLFLSSVLRDKHVSHQQYVNDVVQRGITSSSDNGSGDPVSVPSYCKASFQPVPPRAVNEKAKHSSRLNSLLQRFPSSGSFFAFMVGNAKESPTHRTTQDALESPLPCPQGISARRAGFEAVTRGLQVIKNADLEELQKLGSGTFGTVYHGKWRGTDVAIKWIKTSSFSGGPSQHEKREDFWSEASLLAQLHHPNIMALYGVVPEGRRGALGTVTEYMVDGSLKHVLQRKGRPIDHRKRVLLAMDAAFGMEYLHAKNIVHFDIKSENLLVNMRDPQRPICKIGDFGLSEIKHHKFVSGGARGTLPWMAPELLRGSNSMVSEKVDVYSFGIVMWELLTGQEPYADMNDPAIIGGVQSNSLRPPVPHNCDPQWRALMEACWSSDPSARPSFTDVVSTLRAMAIYSQRAWDII